MFLSVWLEMSLSCYCPAAPQRDGWPAGSVIDSLSGARIGGTVSTADCADTRPCVVPVVALAFWYFLRAGHDERTIWWAVEMGSADKFDASVSIRRLFGFTSGEVTLYRVRL